MKQKNRYKSRTDSTERTSWTFWEWKEVIEIKT